MNQITLPKPNDRSGQSFLNTDQLIEQILSALQKNQIEQAVVLYQKCQSDIGFTLIYKVQANKDLFQRTANLLYRTRDFEKAAYCCEHLGETKKAAELYAHCDDHERAAEMYVQAGELELAAQMFEKHQRYSDAAQLYERTENYYRASECRLSLGEHLKAGQLQAKAGKRQRAIEILQLIDLDHFDAVEARVLMAEIFVQEGYPDMARQALSQLQQARTIDADAVSAWEQLAILEAKSARWNEAAQLATEILKVKPDHQAARSILDQSKSQAQQAAPVQEAPVVQPTAPTNSGAVAPVMEWFDVLSQLPLFAELTLAQLRTVYHLCEVRAFEPNAVLIQGGSEGQALWILLEGQATVLSPQSQRVVATLNPGDHVGEMSLLEAVPASATVVTKTAGQVLRLDRAGFQGALSADSQLAMRVYRIFLSNLSSRLRHTTEMVG